jgi:LPXTG-site transpeptidase (sortase) family protein
MPPLQVRRWLRRASWVLMGLGVLVVGRVGLAVAYESYEQHHLLADWDRDHPAVPDARPSGSATFLSLRPHLADGAPIAKMTVPNVGFSAVVTEGADTGILSRGPGHDVHTAYPGENGLILIGNHNGFSSSWGGIHPGDRVALDTDYGQYSYRVLRRSIVDGEDRSYIDATPTAERLVMVTCWPLWQGSFAHDRLVIVATPVTSG